MTTFAVVTPTIGLPHLKDCITSLKGQDCLHYLFIDGIEHYEKVNEIVRQCGHDKLRLNYLHANIGKAGGNWYGHRVYAAASFLVNEDVICYMDEDNWVNSHYIQAFKDTLRHDAWAFTLRDIHSKEGEFLCQDNCESLGQWPVHGYGTNYHIDTSCFAIPKSIAVQIGHRWYGQYAADRTFFHNLKAQFPNFHCTKKHTVKYRLDGNPNSVTKEFFELGNQRVAEKYQGEYPWHDQVAMLVINTNLASL